MSTPIKVEGSLLGNNTTSKQPKSQLPVPQKLTNDDDNFVVVHTPYKFTPKKLTKKQKSKLSRRRDDIPALYQDLSQSQSQNLNSNSESFPDLPVSDDNLEEKTVKQPENMDIEMNEIEKPEETTEPVRPFAELSKTYTESTATENTETSLLENGSPKTSENKPSKVKRGRRKSTGNVKKASVERNAAIFDYAGIIFTDNEAQRPNSIRKTLPDRDFESDNDIIRKRVQKELQRIKIDVNDSEEYKNKSTKRRRRSDYFMTGDLMDNKKVRKSKGNSELNATVDLAKDTSTKANEKSSEKKTAKIKTFMKPSEVSIEKEIRDNGKAEETIQMESDLEPVIDSSQERELNCKPFKIPALHQFQNIKPGEHIVIKDCQSTVDLVVKGPKATSPFKVINKSGVRLPSGRNLFPECDDSESLVIVEDLEIAEADTSNLEKQNNSSVKDQTALDCDNNSSSVVIASTTEESDGNDTLHMSHLHIEPDSTNISLVTINCDENSVACASKDTVPVNPNDTTVSINSQFIAELDAAARNNSVVEMPDDDIACRKLVFNTSASSDESVNRNSEFHSPPPSEHRNSIVTSPICSDTPTRNSELIRNTLQISPIKDVRNCDSDTTFTHTESMSNSVIASTSTKSDKNKDTSPVLFSNDNVGEINKSVSESKQDYNGTPIVRKNKSRYLSTRGAQMMNMVSANRPLGTNGTRKQKIASKFSINKQVFSPQQSRIAKMMGQFEKNGNQESGTDEEGVEQQISEQDIFCFSKELPKPTDLPSVGILKKRKAPGHPDDGIVPASKRKRVNFSDPEVSCRKYIANNAPSDMSAARMENMMVDDLDEALLITNTLTENINLQLTDVKYDNSRPICAELETCLDSIDVIVETLATPDYIDAYAGNLQAADIHTVADLARLTEYEVNQLPLMVEKVKEILTDYSKRIRMKPVSLASVLEIDEDTRTESVIIPPAVPIVEDTKIAANSEPLFTDELCNGQTEMDMSLEEEDYNLPSTSTVQLNESANRDSTSRCLSSPKNTLNSPTTAKENILDVIVSGVPVNDIVQTLRSALNDSRYDIKPLVTMLCGSNNRLMNTAANMGHLKVDPTELLKYVTTTHSLSDIVRQYDSATIEKSLNGVREPNTVHSTNPSDCLDNMSVEQLGEYIVTRFGETPDMDSFLTMLFNKMPLDRYLQPVPRDILTASPTPANRPETLDDRVRCAIREFKEGTVSDSVVKEMYEAACSKMNLKEMFNAHCQEMKKRL